MERLKRSGIKIPRNPRVEIQNIVASINLGGEVYVEKAAAQFPRSMYEPEQFPGLILRVSNPRAVFLIFASGKLVCTGAKSEAEVFRAVNNLHRVLDERGLMMY